MGGETAHPARGEKKYTVVIAGKAKPQIKKKGIRNLPKRISAENEGTEKNL